MRLSCPSCGAAYELPETLFLTGPRKVRCVKCAHSWMAGERAAADPAASPASPPAGAPDAPEVAADGLARRPLPLRRRAPPVEAPTPIPDLSLAAPDQGRAGRGVAVAWIASLLLLGAGCWAGWEYRADVMAAWPASARLYGALGGHTGG
jgi:predicted Zn finger-like uncharacterized protein